MDAKTYDASATVFLSGVGSGRNFTVAAHGSRDECIHKLQLRIADRLGNTTDLPVTIHYSFIQDGE